LGGKKGGKARYEKLTLEERKLIATKAAKAQWEKKQNRRFRKWQLTAEFQFNVFLSGKPQNSFFEI
jgi:hypothetical protein